MFRVGNDAVRFTGCLAVIYVPAAYFLRPEKLRVIVMLEVMERYDQRGFESAAADARERVMQEVKTKLVDTDLNHVHVEDFSDKAAHNSAGRIFGVFKYQRSDAVKNGIKIFNVMVGADKGVPVAVVMNR
jgi:hypothetical protein